MVDVKTSPGLWEAVLHGRGVTQSERDPFKAVSFSGNEPHFSLKNVFWLYPDWSLGFANSVKCSSFTAIYT